MEIKKENEVGFSMAINTEKSIFMGKITRKRYKLEDHKNRDGSYWSNPSINEWVECTKIEKIAECVITRPPFDVKETVYIAEIKKYVTIERMTRGTDGSIYYNTSYVISELLQDTLSLKEKDDTETKLIFELVKYREVLTKTKEVTKIEEEKLDILYLDPFFENGVSSILCYYKDKRCTYINIDSAKLEDILIKSYYLGIDKENTEIYIDTRAIGIWFYEVLLSKGYKVNKINLISEEFNK